MGTLNRLIEGDPAGSGIQGTLKEIALSPSPLKRGSGAEPGQSLEELSGTFQSECKFTERKGNGGGVGGK